MTSREHLGITAFLCYALFKTDFATTMQDGKSELNSSRTVS